MKKNLIFFGNYLSVLRCFSESFNVLAVITEARKCSDEIRRYCDDNLFTHIQIETLDELIHQAQEWHAPVGIVASFGKIFNDNHIKCFESLYNFHPGCIEKNRGRHPLPNAILRGHKTMSLTVHKILDKSIDAGDLISKIEIPINYEDTYTFNCNRLLKWLPVIAQDLVDQIQLGCVQASAIKVSESAYFPPLSSEDLEKITTAPSLMRWKI